jgi:hypothetical protein
MLKLLLSSLRALVALSFIGSTCDYGSDACDRYDPASSYCTADNVAVTCLAPGEERHAREVRTPCGESRACRLDDFHAPVCVRNPPAECAGSEAAALDAGVPWTREGVVECDPSPPKKLQSICVPLFDGGGLWADIDPGAPWWQRRGDECPLPQ